MPVNAKVCIRYVSPCFFLLFYHKEKTLHPPCRTGTSNTYLHLFAFYLCDPWYYCSGPLGIVCVYVLMSSVPSGMSLMNVWRKTWFSLLPMLATPSFLFHRRKMIGDRFHPAGLVILVLVWTDRSTDVSSFSNIIHCDRIYTEVSLYVR